MFYLSNFIRVSVLHFDKILENICFLGNFSEVINLKKYQNLYKINFLKLDMKKESIFAFGILFLFVGFLLIFSSSFVSPVLTCGTNESSAFTGCAGTYSNLYNVTGGQCLAADAVSKQSDCNAGTDSLSCNGISSSNCYWQDSYEQVSCSALSEPTCVAKTECTATYECQCIPGNSIQVIGKTSECSGTYSFTGGQCDYNILPKLKTSPVCYGLIESDCTDLIYCSFTNYTGTAPCPASAYPNCPTGCSTILVDSYGCGPTCLDSDGGNYPLIPGNVTKAGQTYKDVCYGGSTISEYYCDSSTGNVLSGTNGCPSGSSCVNDALGQGYCQNITNTCSDTDSPTQNYTQKGTITANNGITSGTDTCATTSKLTEYYCNAGNSGVSESFNCGASYNCANGACVLNVVAPNTCSDTDSPTINYTQRGTVTDTCATTSMLTEYYCSQQNVGVSLSNNCGTNGCSAGACNSAPAPTCSDGLINQGEKYIDFGGPNCASPKDAIWEDYDTLTPITSINIESGKSKQVIMLARNVSGVGKNFNVTLKQGISWGNPFGIDEKFPPISPVKDTYPRGSGYPPDTYTYYTIDSSLKNSPSSSGSGNSETWELYFAINPSSSTLSVTFSSPAAVCGDGVTTSPEVCDDGNNVTETCAYGNATSYNICNAGCTTGLTCPAQYCGDGTCNTPDENSTNCLTDCPTVPVKSAYWTPNSITMSSGDVGTTSFLLTLTAPSANPGAFEIKEKNVWYLPDDVIGNFYGTLSSGNLIYNWTPTSTDFKNDLGGGIYEYYFNVDGISSSSNLVINLSGVIPPPPPPPPPVDPCLNINICGDYTDSVSCVADSCKVAVDSVPPLLPTQNVSCIWNLVPVPEVCKPKVSSISNDGTVIGSCIYNENASTDDCSDGFLSHAWTANWTWDSTNVYILNPNLPGYILGSDGKYHYDPQGAALTCQSGSSTIPCPAQVQLSFFDWKNLVAVVILISLLYFLLEKSKKKREKAERKSGKKRGKKSSLKKKKIVKKNSSKRRVGKRTSSKKK